MSREQAPQKNLHLQSVKGEGEGGREREERKAYFIYPIQGTTTKLIYITDSVQAMSIHLQPNTYRKIAHQTALNTEIGLYLEFKCV